MAKTSVISINVSCQPSSINRYCEILERGGGARRGTMGFNKATVMGLHLGQWKNEIISDDEPYHPFETISPFRPETELIEA